MKKAKAKPETAIDARVRKLNFVGLDAGNWDEAAAHIAALEAENARLRDALERVAAMRKVGTWYNSDRDGEIVHACRIARAVLATAPAPEGK